MYATHGSWVHRYLIVKANFGLDRQCSRRYLGVTRKFLLVLKIRHQEKPPA
jgi:hypothetical protein